MNPGYGTPFQRRNYTLTDKLKTHPLAVTETQDTDKYDRYPSRLNFVE